MSEISSQAPTVSVIVPAYNAARYITDCLESISRQRGNIPLEIIVVDDGSTDGTRDKVDAFGRARLIKQENAGPSAARNRGIEEAAGDYVAFLDSDDLWAEDKLAVQMEIFRTHPEVALVFGNCLRFSDHGPLGEPFFLDSGLNESYWGDPVVVEDAYVKLFETNYIPTGSVVLRKSCLDACGMFDESKRYVEDLDLWLRIAFKFPIAFTKHVCQLKRQHEGCVSNDAELMTVAFIQVLEQQRKRHGDLLKAKGIHLRPRYAMEYCVLGYRCEREGRRAEARRWYSKALLTYPSARPAYYYLRSFWDRVAKVD
jgi:glycosyltransferase involved in cell wall biosynthesis